MKLVVFDLDDTLAPIGRPIAQETLAQIRELQSRGIKIALCSGKPVYYLCGVLRQAGLNAPILLGENGAAMQVGIDLPPAEHYTLPYSQAARESIRLLRAELEQRLPQLWYQPNQVGLTPFFRTQEENAAIGQCIADCADRTADIDVYPQRNCYDVMPKSISKAEGMRTLCRYLGIPIEACVAVGDGINDYPMFACAGYSIGIHLADPSHVDYNAPDIDAAMARLLALTQEASLC